MTYRTDVCIGFQDLSSVISRHGVHYDNANRSLIAKLMVLIDQPDLYY